jgi:hypothetical protein
MRVDSINQKTLTPSPVRLNSVLSDGNSSSPNTAKGKYETPNSALEKGIQQKAPIYSAHTRTGDATQKTHKNEKLDAEVYPEETTDKALPAKHRLAEASSYNEPQDEI